MATGLGNEGCGKMGVTIIASSPVRGAFMAAESQDRDILRGLASRWMELAHLPVMAARKRQWTALKDLRP